MENQILDFNPNKKEKLVIARGWKRFVNALIDSVVMYIIAIIFTAILIISGRKTMNNIGQMELFAIMLFVQLIYFPFFETVFGKTIGKMITRTEVLTAEGEKPDFNTIFKRTLCRFIPFESFTFFDKYPVGLHDSISKTIVVNSK